jgi:hypothetical protein
LAIGGGLTLEVLLSSCTTIAFKEEAPVIYPLLKSHKVQPPEKGCFIGMGGEAGSMARWRGTDFDADHYKTILGIKPKITFIQWAYTSSSFFPAEKSNEIASGEIPYICRVLQDDIKKYGWGDMVKNKWSRKDLEEYAKDIVKFGKSIFISTMHEMNGTSYPRRAWKNKSASSVKKLWTYMWQIFEDNGANEYAT